MMTINRPIIRRLGAVAVLAIAAGATTAWTAAAHEAAPSTEPPTPPIAVEEFTRVDADTPMRGNVTDDVTASISITAAGMDPVAIDIANLSNIAVGRFTVQPGAQFPWHSHAGPVLVSIVEGELVYVMADGCVEHSYTAGTAFVDPGRGHIHSAYNPTDGNTVFVATFLEATADGPLSITEGITAPADNCGLPAPSAP
jgi:quercetin dioxygenase-like cupin family protein